jgi:uncharacterized caspase-like protein
MMSKPEENIFIVLLSDQLAESEIDELNRLTRELGEALESQKEMVQEVSFVNREKLPKDRKVAGELMLAQQAIIQLIPIVTPWILGKIDNIIKSFSKTGKQIKARVHVGNQVIQITSKTTASELAKATQQVKAIGEISQGQRYALVIGNSNYQDERLPDLKSSIVDAERFAELLADQKVGAFTHVEKLIDENSETVKRYIERFFSKKTREDLLLLYFSGHGIRSQSGQLFLAAKDTSQDYLRSTGIPANFIKENMDESYSQRQILLLDCCYGGAMVEGSKSGNEVGQPVNSISAFQSSGFGRIIITASESMQYAYDGDRVDGHTENSAFTNYLIEGLGTGNADSDNDGLVDINELYQYAYQNVIPKQTPNISSTSQEGRIFIGLNPNPKIRLAQLPEQLMRALHSEERLLRQGAVAELAHLLKSNDPATIMAAEAALKQMASDDSVSVRNSASNALDQHFGKQNINSHAEPAAEAQPTTQTHKGTIQAPQVSIQNTIPTLVIKTPVNIQTPPQSIPAQNTPNKMSPPQKTPKSLNTGGFLNVIVPGGAQAYAGNWGRAFITFITVAFLVYILSQMGSTICASGVIIEIIYMFIAGRNIIIKYNKKIDIA